MKPVFPDINVFLFRETFNKWHIPERIIQDHEIVFITEGYGKTVISGHEYILEKGTIVYYPPFVSHKLFLDRKPYMKFYGVHFNIEDNLQIPYIMHVSNDTILILFRQLYRSYTQKNMYSSWNNSLILSNIILRLYKQLESNFPISSFRVQKTIEYMSQYYGQALSLQDLCDNVSMKKSNFCKTFRDSTGKTPMEYLQHLRIEYAKDKLINTDDKISEIAHQCGFEDEFYFAKVFRRICGITPSMFRKMY